MERKRGRGVWICPKCGTIRSFPFGPMHYPADGRLEYCGGEPIPVEEDKGREPKEPQESDGEAS